MVLHRSLLTFGMAVLAGSVILAGCSANPENSPKIQKKFAQVDEMQKSVDESAQILRTIAGEMTMIKDQLAAFQSMNPESTSGSELITRLGQLEERLAKMETGTGERIVAQATSNAGAASATPATDAATGGLATKRITAEKAEPAVDRLIPKDQLSTRATPKSAEKKAEPTKKAEPKTTNVTQASKTTASGSNKGGYYTIQAGDTLTSIAAKHGVDLSSLESANRIPKGATVLKGQRIYIPGK
jgi:LysM repeat protein